MQKYRLNLFVLVWKKKEENQDLLHALLRSQNCRVYLTNDAHISHAKTDVVLKYSLKSDGVHQVCYDKKSLDGVLRSVGNQNI